MSQAELTLYRDLLSDIKTRVRQAQHKAPAPRHGIAGIEHEADDHLLDLSGVDSYVG